MQNSEAHSAAKSSSVPQTRLKNQFSGVSRNNETSMVSAEVFYSPIVDVENDGNKSSDEDRNIEILPQYSANKHMRGNGMTVYERR